MEAEMVSTESPKQNMIWGLVVLVVVGIVGYYLIAKPGTNANPPAVSKEVSTPVPQMDFTTPGEVIINLVGGNYYFDPKVITVNKGDKVKVVMTNKGGMHDFVIDKLNIKSEIIKDGETTTLSFVANEIGEYEYYCSLPSHKEKGMVGMLVVK